VECSTKEQLNTLQMYCFGHTQYGKVKVALVVDHKLAVQ